MSVSFDALSSPQRLVSLYAEMDLALLSTGDGDATATAVTQLAVRAVPGVEQASISVGRQGRFSTVASTGDIASVADGIQYELASGPCVDAILDETVFRSADIAADPRWPEFGTRAHSATGAVSMLSLRLFMEGDDRIAGLNLYSTKPDAFDDDAQVIATVLATHSALAISAAAVREKAENLTRALSSNRHIGMAMGILMHSYNLAEDDAFALLRIASQNSNRKLSDIAGDVIRTGTLKMPAPATATRRRPSTGASA